MALIDQAVTEGPGGWDFVCPVNDGTCGGKVALDEKKPDELTVVPFTSRGWPTKTLAKARGLEHFEDHKSGIPMSELADFRAKHGLTVSTEGNLVTAKDL